MPNGLKFPKFELPDIAGVMGAGPQGVLSEIRRSLNMTAASFEAALPFPTPAAPAAGFRSPKEFIKGLEVQMENAMGIKPLISIADMIPGPTPAEVEVGEVGTALKPAGRARYS